MDTNNFNKLGVYELRNYARAVGVKCPTAKRRGQLIEEIRKINNGELMPFNLVRGRTAKETDRLKILYKVSCMEKLINKYELLVLGVKDLYELVGKLDKDN